MKVIVAHPSKQHSFYTAIALKKSGVLFRYITSVYDKKNTWVHFLKNCLSSKNQNKASTRKISQLDDSDVLIFNELSALLILCIRRVPFLNRILYNKIFVWRRKKFGRAVAKYAIRNNVDAVIMYDSTAVECFALLKSEAPHIKRILDVSISHRLFMKKNFEIDMAQTQNIQIMKEEAILWDENLMRDYIQEVKDSDYFFSPSQIVKKSLVYAGANENAIKIIPYGVNVEQFLFRKKKVHSHPLKLLYVGQITHRKGMHHLLKIISAMPSSQIMLALAGDYSKTSELYLQYKKCENIQFLGFVTRNILAEFYQNCDLFVFPTLGEGYGLVVLEALSTGTPVLSSNLAGGNDIIKDGYNGFVFQGGDDEGLRRLLSFLIENMNIIPAMSENARTSVMNMSWDTYYSKIQKAINEIVNI